MKNLVRTAAVAFLAVAVSGPAMAANQLTATWWYNIAGYDYYPTETTINNEVNYTSGATPDSIQTVSVDPVNFSETYGSYTALKLATSLNITTAGLYTFTVSADDAARISIDGTAIVENAFWGNYQLDNPQVASIYLTAGAHSYDAFSFQLGGGQYFNASISGPADVSFGAAAIPEPASWLLMITGFGLVGASLRRRSTNAIAA